MIEFSVNFWFALAVAYLCGSIPTAYLFGRALKKIDIRQHGSGNVGATNAFRVLGKKIGTTVLLLDILKGVIPVVVAGSLFGLKELALVLVAVVAVCGHNWTIFLQFKGGKGIATSLGVLIGLAIKIPTLQAVVLSVIIVWSVVFLLSGYVSLASIIAATLLPVFMVWFNNSFILIILGVVFAAFVLLRHRPNMRRLFAGQESRVQIFKNKREI